ncbi:MAG TPA: asparagine synthase (glutamine-hydrolyzing), partial [Fimbriimonadaceae bacterium]|nr:asparagine synthase (glutamine-hydrolyzing) [Fimbriimonadaceae bacterium]
MLDLSPAGNQPMVDASGQYALVFNGCIYNFMEIRRELEARGVWIQSSCDTEVLLQGLITWEASVLLGKLRGMFAFAFWNNRERSLLLARDRLGVKPLYVLNGDEGLAFASSPSSFRAAGLVDDIDPVAMLEFLEFGHTIEQTCIWRNAWKLAPGTSMSWSNGHRREVSRYWSLPSVEPRPITDSALAAAADEAEELLLEATRLRLTSDVKVGALLSAGIDSTLVCWALRKLKADIGTFTVATPGDPSDESAEAATTARQLDLSHQVVDLPPDGASNLEELTSAYGEPFAISSALAMLRVSAAIRPHATVLLTGDGGDDVFLGYPYHLNFYRAQRLARIVPPGGGTIWRLIRPVVSLSPLLRRAVHLADYATGGLGAITRVHDGLPYYIRKGILGPRLVEMTLSCREIPLSSVSARRLLADELDHEQRVQFSGEFLPKVDGATMYHSLEARSPFLDTVLWEFAARLPFGLRLYGGVLKAVLRKVVRRRLGPAIALRRKQGFTIPVEKWLA